jgi:hypothetical protein
MGRPEECRNPNYLCTFLNRGIRSVAASTQIGCATDARTTVERNCRRAGELVVADRT